MSDIDPIEFGKMQAEISALRRDTDRQTQLLERMELRLSELTSQLTEARGGWRMLMLIGGGAAAAGGTVMAMAQKVFKVLG